MCSASWNLEREKEVVLTRKDEGEFQLAEQNTKIEGGEKSEGDILSFAQLSKDERRHNK
jgi:hypothetical protein